MDIIEELVLELLAATAGPGIPTSIWLESEVAASAVTFGPVKGTDGADCLEAAV